MLLHELCEIYEWHELHGFHELNAKVEEEDKYKYCFAKTEKTNKQKQVNIMDTGVSVTLYKFSRCLLAHILTTCSGNFNCVVCLIVLFYLLLVVQHALLCNAFP